MAKLSFSERCAQFWQWFAENEGELSELLVDPGPDQWEGLYEQARQGVALITDDVHFVIGGDHQFSFTVADHKELFFLLPYLVAGMPDGLRGKWSFSPSLIADPDGQLSVALGAAGLADGAGTGLGEGAELQASQVLVAPTVNPDDATVSLHFYIADWLAGSDALPPGDAWTAGSPQVLSAFNMLLDLSIGESLASITVTDVEQSETASEGMIPLPELRAWLIEALFVGREPGNLTEVFFTYQRDAAEVEPADGGYPAGGSEPADGSGEPVGSNEPAGSPAEGGPADGSDPDQLVDGEFRQPIQGFQPRMDILVGSASPHPLLAEYYGGQNDSYFDFVGCGAKPLFLFFEHGGGEGILAERNALLKRIEGEVLGQVGSGSELGILLGAATGTRCSYIDLLLYDEQAALMLLADLLADYPNTFYAKEFYREGVEFALLLADDDSQAQDDVAAPDNPTG